jgi:hypothetical protein
LFETGRTLGISLSVHNQGNYNLYIILHVTVKCKVFQM